MRRLYGLILALGAFALFAADETLLLQRPAVSADHVAFLYGGDLWVADRNGDNPRRLTVQEGMETNAHFSPDGKWIAFQGNYDGNTDVYIVPVQGGDPKRLTYHPNPDSVHAWTDQGEVLFSSVRDVMARRGARLYTISHDEAFPTQMPMTRAYDGDTSPDGKHIVYTETNYPFTSWKRYRGGQMPRLWVLDLKTYDHVEIPAAGSNNAYPVWLDDTIYFISDRNHHMNVFAYDVKDKTVRQITQHEDFDVKSLNGSNGTLIYDQGGRLHTIDTKTGKTTTLNIHINADLPSRRPHFVKASEYVRSAGIAPNGKRAVFETRGEIISVPVKKGDMRNITRSPGVHDRSPAFSPDGLHVAYFSDETGEYQLYLRDAKGLKPAERIELPKENFYHDPVWSPDGKALAFHDKRLNLWTLTLEDKKPVLVDTDTYDHPVRTLDPAWSPDSRWITYSKRLKNHMRAIFVYDTTNGEKTQVTDSAADAISPRFDLAGRHLFFAVSTDFGLNTAWLDMSSYDRSVTRAVYAAVLRADDPSPLAPESDEAGEEKPAEEEGDDKEGEEGDKEEEKEEPGTTRIDFENLDQRIIALPMPERAYAFVRPVANGGLLVAEAVDNQRGLSVHRFDFKERKHTPFISGIFGVDIDVKGEHMLYTAPGNRFGVVKTSGKVKVGDGAINLASHQILVDPVAEWRQIFEETYRIERDYFYVANLHGLDWEATREKYRPMVAHVSHRFDLTALLADFIGELVIGHNYVGGGAAERAPTINVGLLGADYEVADGRYRIKTIYHGQNFNPELRAPLTEPGVDVNEGDYILAVNGEPVTSKDNIFRFFQNTANRQTILTLNSKPEMDGAREVTVVPLTSERNLRVRNWVENNRRKVQEATDGRVAYAYIPNTSGAGYEGFNRGYFNSLDADAIILDERFNGGGSAADYMIDILNRKLLNFWGTREGEMQRTPNAAIFGPKVMIIDQFAGSGGDALPLYFRRAEQGKLIGQTTWGGLVGIYDYPVLIDGGFVMAPRIGILSPDGEWEVENVGVKPDIFVDQTPKETINGGDPQLERAIAEILKELETYQPPKLDRPPGPNRVKRK